LADKNKSQDQLASVRDDCDGDKKATEETDLVDEQKEEPVEDDEEETVEESEEDTVEENDEENTGEIGTAIAVTEETQED
jgi:hypothetical protein